ncbi:hypothetical protein ERJ75_001002400 [Trypanosoma vivax]|uniref:B-block binding subunit of TFIIIC domain-containing protein n=1 Tax=Trypanosoma vivax (strain Y486) TaxID=1055687 RepID=G0UAZ3_TRYVY|nr:hypothetical protein TRVL_03221 [Trypanosoma vivax]KAH8611714.1 hypothetical protein ERJ75_001002400 [Trypanosoma vivax]CCC52980.1 conserved hypothetical protein [Trypanosoma vivax Y486]
MFREILDNVLEFVGSHSEREGCTGSEVASFISCDVLPKYGLVGHSTVQKTVTDLLLSNSDGISVRHHGKPVAWEQIAEGNVPVEECHFCPSVTLQEKVLGIPLRRKEIRLAVDYACDHLVTGFVRYESCRGKKGSMKSPERGVAIGVRVLLARKWLRNVYIYDASRCQLVPHVVPHFAVTSPCNDISLGSEFVRPLQLYLKRRRSLLRPNRVMFDPSVVRRVVLSSPDRQLVLEDAIHAIFSVHGEEVPKTNKKNFRKTIRVMLAAAGLRVVKAVISVGLKKRVVQVVVDSVHPNNVTCSTNIAGRDSGNAVEDESDEDGEESDREEGESDRSSISGEQSSDDGDERCSEADTTMPTAGCSSSLSELRGDGDVFYVDPSFPFLLQLVKQAEVRPLVLESAIPKVVLRDFSQARKELYRYVHAYAERWKTLEFTRVLSRHSKTFTCLMHPAGWCMNPALTIKGGGNRDNDKCCDGVVCDNAGSDGEKRSASLPKGVTQWAINKIMEAIQNSQEGAVSLPELTKVVDRRTLGRVLPYLRECGRITTTGVTAPRGRRIGVVVASGVELTEEKRAFLVQRYITQISLRANKRSEQAVQLTQLPTPVIGDVSFSDAASAIAKDNARKRSLWEKITMLRNGYSRSALFRQSRLHIELCRIWCNLGQQPSTPLTLEFLLSKMSLSTFCIVVGVAGIDLTAYTSVCGAQQVWGTPLDSLTPTLRNYCNCVGVQSFLHSLAGLQEKRLVICHQQLSADMNEALGGVSISLAVAVDSVDSGEGRGWKEESEESCARDREPRTHIFFPPSDSTTYGICCAVLGYWRECWVEEVNASRVPSRVASAMRQIATAESNISNLQILALSKLLRMDAGLLSEYLLQRGGELPVQQKLRDIIGNVHSQHDEDEDDERRFVTAPRRRRRIEINGLSMAEAFQTILQSGQPYHGFVRLQALLLRHGRAMDRGRYNPYRSRIHGSMQSLVQNTLGALRGGVGEETSRPISWRSKAALQEIVASVVTPNFTACSHASNSPQKTVASDDRVTGPDSAYPVQGSNYLDTHFSSLPATPHGQSSTSEPSECLQDIIRMILLSDEAHYDAATAKALLSQFREEEVHDCINWLLAFPSFRSRTSATGRLPRIELSPVLSLAPVSVASSSTHHLSVSARLAQHVASASLLAPQCGVHRLCVPTVLHPDGGPFESAPRLTHQPFVHLESSGAETLQNAELAVLRLPSFSWPPTAKSERSSGAPLQPLRCPPAARVPILAEGPDILHPSRALLRPWNRLVLLGLRDITADPPPTAEEKERVRAATVAPSVEQGTMSSPMFPSVFHHVDGSFHDFFWRSFLFAVYVFVQHSPGITEKQLEQQMRQSGLASSRSLKVAIEFLKASFVIASRQVMQPRDATSSPFSEVKEMGGEQVSHEGYSYVNCYFCTVSQNGPWNVIDL